MSPAKALVADLSDRENGGVRLSPGPEKRRENLPPGGVSSLEDQFRSLSVDVADLHAASTYQI